MGDRKAKPLHALLHVVHLRFNAVLVLQQIPHLKMLEDLEDKLPLLFTRFFSRGQPTLFFAFYLQLEVPVEILLHVLLQVHVLGDQLRPTPKLFGSCLLGHLKAHLLELVLDEPLYHLVLLAELSHEMLEQLVTRCTWLGWVHHVQQSDISPILYQKIFPFCLVRQLPCQQPLPQQCSKGDTVDPFPQSFLFGNFLLMFFLSIEYIINKGADSVIWMKCLCNLIIFILDTNIVPFCIIFHIVSLQQLAKGLTIGLLCCLCLLLLFLRQFIHIILKSILTLMLLKQPPSRIRHEIIGYPMHLALRSQCLVLFQHFEETYTVDLSLSPFLLITYLLQLCNILIEIFLLIAYLQQLPSVIILTELYTGVPFCCSIDAFMLEQCHKLSFNLLCLGKRLLLLQPSLFSILASLFLQFNPVFLHLVRQLPTRFSRRSIIIKFLSLGSSVLLPIGMLQHLLCGLETLGHLILRFFCGAVVVVSGTVDRLMDRPDFTLLFESHGVVHIIRD